ncbi:MAG TPA: GMC family oxidoreductase [Gammaproteobacteria bacterium]|nr:GMC family oxidoreductase [Gammaproteobacteria bacterium]
MELKVVPASRAAKNRYELVVIGSGFGSSFFLVEALKRIQGRILVIEWGGYQSWDWQVKRGVNARMNHRDTFTNKTEKYWNFTVGFGGGTNCWFAQTPRLHPSDFSTKSLYGVADDWPVSYADLEPYYAEAEAIMAVSGDPDMAAMFPRSTAYPQPPHRPTAIDRIMKQKQPERHFVMPTARARVATDTRPACCSNARCNLCPIQAKFTALNGFEKVYTDPRVHVCLDSEVRSLDARGGVVNKAVFRQEGKDYRVAGDLFVLGANAIQSPAILLRSGMDSGNAGQGLHEQVGVNVEVFLEGLDNFDGSTITTGLNYSLYDGAFRKDHASCLIYFENRWSHGLRKEPGRWRETLPLVIVAEDIPAGHNRVTIQEDTGQATVTYQGESDYARRGIEVALEKLPGILEPLPVEAIHFRGNRSTEAHLQGTLKMGDSPDHSVVDAGQLHHQYRNLAVVGTPVFPSCACANPSLTAAALSLRAARRML